MAISVSGDMVIESGWGHILVEAPLTDSPVDQGSELPPAPLTNLTANGRLNS